LRLTPQTQFSLDVICNKMSSNIWYTATDTYDPDYKTESWDNYLKWSKLAHLSELVSLDGTLNGLVFEPDFDSEDDWKHIITDGYSIVQFFNSIEYVLEKTKGLKYFNLLAVVKEPKRKLSNLYDEFDFIGYDLIETGGNVSALTNCGGFDESFLPEDLNKFGLVTEWKKAKRIQSDLKINNPEEHHADCFLYEVWRHKIIGRKNRTSI